MNVQVAIHQPNYIPWLGYFYKIYCADVFVFLDDVQFSKGSFANRNKIKTLQNTEFLLTVPVVHPKGEFPDYNKIQIDYRQKWQKRHLSTIQQNYSKAPYFKDIFPGFENIVLKEYRSLADLNITIISYFSDLLNIRTRKVCSSEIRDETGAQTERLVKICKYFNGNSYLSGKGGLKYQDEEAFGANDICLTYTNYKAFKYKQLKDSFMPNLSILDTLFHCSIDEISDYFQQLSKEIK